MPVAVRIAGLDWSWRTDGDANFDAWVAKRPWCAAANPITVQWPAADSDPSDYVRRCAYGEDSGATNLRVVSLENVSSLHDSLADWIGIHIKTTRELANRLSEDVAIRPTLFVARISESVACESALELASDVVEFCSKNGRMSPAFTLVHGRDQSPMRGTCRFDRGWPSGLRAKCLEDSHAWNAYLHLRVAWEVQGELDDATSFEHVESLTGVRIGDDESFERALNNFAVNSFRMLTDDEQLAWKRYATTPREDRPSTVRGRRVDFGGMFTPFPWLTRALLVTCRQMRIPVRWMRQDLVCRPLVEQILMICFNAEARMRAFMQNDPATLPNDDAIAAYNRYSEGGSLESRMYPLDHPAKPVGPWDFASMGSTLKHVKSPSSVRSAFQQAMFLRNAVAHGHYVGWGAVSQARSIASIDY